MTKLEEYLDICLDNLIMIIATSWCDKNVNKPNLSNELLDCFENGCLIIKEKNE